MANCRHTSKNRVFIFEEKRSKLTLQNIRLVESTKIKVDGCEINDSGIRCDFMHITSTLEFYIELKGQDIEHALEQIERTINLLSSNSRNQPKISYIICSRSPLSSTAIQNYQATFRKKYSSKLIVRSSPHIDTY